MKLHNKLLKKNIVKNCGGGALLFLSNISLISLGFSSWMVSAESRKYTVGNINVAVGNVKENLTISKGIFYIFKSEYAFKYFYKTDGTTNEYVCTEPRLGFKVKINPTELSDEIQKLSPKPSQLYVDTRISYTTSADFDMVSGSNTNAIAPGHLVYSLVDRPEYIFESENTACSYSHGSGDNTGSISARTLLYEDGENSLLEFTKNFSVKGQNEYTYFNVYLPFELKSGFSFEDYKNLTFDFSVSLNMRRT